MESRKIVSISNNTDIGKGWRVRAFSLPADWNSLGLTLAEGRCKTEKQARAWAADLAAQYDATIQG